MAMVIPRSRSSGALSIEANERNWAPPLRARYFVIAAVSVVLPWSMWPMVPTLTCGLVRSNFFLAMRYLLFSICGAGGGGAHNRTRTDDLFLTKEVLCRLSYVGSRADWRPGLRAGGSGGQGGNRTPTVEDG